MSQPIRIITDSGIELDIAEGTTIEVTSGGISLLSLADREMTYTNNISFPITTNNAKAFNFSFDKRVKLNNAIPVTVIKSGFHEKGDIKVTGESDGKISAVINFNSLNILNDIKNTKIDTLIFGANNYLFLGTETTFEKVRVKFCTSKFNEYIWPSYGITGTSYEYFAVSRYPNDYESAGLKGIEINSFLLDDSNLMTGRTKKNTVATTIANIFSLAESYLGITFEGDMLTDPFFANSCILLNNCTVDFWRGTSSCDCILRKESNSDLKLGELLKKVAQVWFCELIIDDANSKITFTKLSTELTNTPVNIDGTIKSYNTTRGGFAANNYIKYDIDTSYTDTTGLADNIVSDGAGSKDILKIDSKVPKSYIIDYSMSISWFGRNIYDLSDISGTFIYYGIIGGVSVPIDPQFQMNYRTSKTYLLQDNFDDTSYIYETYTGAQTVNHANILSMSGIYSDVIGSMLENPVILDVECAFNPIIWKSVKESRVITSIQLQGKYWVEDMVYNIVTGATKLKLIKMQQ